MHIPETYSQRFMNSFVGTPEATAQFEQNIREVAKGFPDISTAYDDLQHSAELISRFHTNQLLSSANCDEEATAIWQSMYGNSETGINIAVEAARAVGWAYETHAAVPQEPKEVARNLDRIMRYAYGVAFMGSVVGTYNLAAIKKGRNPRNILHFPFITPEMVTARGGDSTHKTNDFRKSVIVGAVDPAGQLSLQPRYKLSRRSKDRGCPVANIKTESVKSSSALLTFMRTVGNVALQDIYPRQFAIIPATE